MIVPGQGILGRLAMTTMFIFLVIVLLIIADGFFVVSEMAIV
jgi:hypothetical protein